MLAIQFVQALKDQSGFNGSSGSPIVDKVDFQNYTFQQKVTIENVTFADVVRFNSLRFPHGLLIKNCIFTKEVFLKNCVAKSAAEPAKPCKVEILDCRFEQCLLIEDCKFYDGFDFAFNVLHRSCNILKCLLRLNKETIANHPTPVHIWRRLKIHGEFNALGLDVEGGIDLRDMDAAHDVCLDDLRIETALPDVALPDGSPIVDMRHEMAGISLKMTGSRIKGSLFIRSNERDAKCTGQLDLRSYVQGSLILCLDVSIHQIKRVDNTAILLSDAYIGGNLYLGYSISSLEYVTMECYGACKLDRTEIKGELQFFGGTYRVAPFPNENLSEIQPLGIGTAISLQETIVENSVYFKNVRCRGKIQACMTVGGFFAIIRGTISVQKLDVARGVALEMTNANIGQSIGLDSVEAFGQLALGMNVGSAVSMAGCSINIDDCDVEFAIDMRSAEVKHAIIFQAVPSGSEPNPQQRLFTCRGLIDLRVKQAKEIRFEGTEITSPNFAIALNNKKKKTALDFTGANVSNKIHFKGNNNTIKGDILASNLNCGLLDWKEVLVYGQVDLSFAMLQGACDCTQAKLYGGMKLTHATINGDLTLDQALIGSSYKSQVPTAKQVLDLANDAENTPREYYTRLEFEAAEPAAIAFWASLKNLCSPEFDYPIRPGIPIMPWPNGRCLTQLADLMAAEGVTLTQLHQACHQLEKKSPKEPDPCYPMLLLRGLDQRWIAFDFRQAVIRGRLLAEQVRSLQWGAWEFEETTIEGNIKLCSALLIGSFRMEDTQIQGDLDFHQTQIVGDLKIDSSEIKGRAFSEVDDQLHVPYPQVRGDIQLQYSQFKQLWLNLGQKPPAPQEVQIHPTALLLHGVVVEELCLAGQIDASQKPKIDVRGFQFKEWNGDHLEVQPIHDETGYSPAALGKRIFVTVFMMGCFFALALFANTWNSLKEFWVLPLVYLFISVAIPVLLIKLRWQHLKLTQLIIVLTLLSVLVWGVLSHFDFDCWDVFSHQRFVPGLWTIAAACLIIAGLGWPTIFDWQSFIRLWFLLTLPCLIASIAAYTDAIWPACSAGVLLFAAIIFWCVRRWLHGHAATKFAEFLKITEPFDITAYIWVEKYLRNRGEDAAADDVFLARRKKEDEVRHELARTPSKKNCPQESEPSPKVTAASLAEQVQQKLGIRIPPPQKQFHGLKGHLHSFVVNGFALTFLRKFFDLSMGYGVRPRRLLYVFLMFWFLNWSVFSDPHSVERPLTYVQPKNEIAYPRVNGKIPKDKPSLWDAEGGDAMPRPSDDPDYPEPEQQWNQLHGFFMSMRVQFPIILLFAENNWTPASREFSWLEGDEEKYGGCSYENYASVMMLLNLILLPIIIAGSTGYLKQHRSE